MWYPTTWKPIVSGPGAVKLTVSFDTPKDGRVFVYVFPERWDDDVLNDRLQRFVVDPVTSALPDVTIASHERLGEAGIYLGFVASDP